VVRDCEERFNLWIAYSQGRRKNVLLGAVRLRAGHTALREARRSMSYRMEAHHHHATHHASCGHHASKRRVCDADPRVRGLVAGGSVDPPSSQMHEVDR
jgi:hypothetical protein